MDDSGFMGWFSVTASACFGKRCSPRTCNSYAYRAIMKFEFCRIFVKEFYSVYQCISFADFVCAIFYHKCSVHRPEMDYIIYSVLHSTTHPWLTQKRSGHLHVFNRTKDASDKLGTARHSVQRHFVRVAIIVETSFCMLAKFLSARTCGNARL